MTTTTKVVKNWINGAWIDSSASETETVPNPATGETIALVPLSTKEDVNTAVIAAKRAYESWKTVPVPERSRYMFSYLEKLKTHREELAQLLTQENGKTIKDARGEVQRGIECVELATSTPSMMMEMLSRILLAELMAQYGAIH